MPIFAQGYRAYAGPLRPGRWRFLPIAGAAVRRNLRWWTWVLFVASLLFGSAFFYFAVFMVYAGPSMIPSLGGQGLRFFRAVVGDPRVYANMMEYQAIWALVLGTVVGAGEIAEDLRTGALVFYLGKPVTRRDYVLGKVFAVSGPILAVTLLPTLLLFLLQASFESSWGWVADHARVVPAAAGFSLLVCLFVSALVLGVSALARRRRWATVGVAAFHFSLVMTALILAYPSDYANNRERDQFEHRIADAGSDREAAEYRRQRDEMYDALGSPSKNAGLRFLSPTASLQAAGRDLFGLPLPGNFSGGRHWAFLLGLSAAFLAVLWRKVRAVEVVT